MIKFLKSYFAARWEIFKMNRQKEIFLRRLRQVIKTADDMHKTTGRKYYVVNDAYGNPTMITRTDIKELKERGILGKDRSVVDLLNEAHYITK